MVKNCVLGGLLCVAAAGCGANMNTANSLAPSAVSAPSSFSGGGQFALQSIGSCPNGNAPGWLTPWVKGTTVRLRWSEVAPNIEYHVVVQRYDVTNKYMPVENGNFFTSGTWAELTLSPGRYEGMIQTKSCGTNMGPWSQSLQFSVDEEDQLQVDIESQQTHESVEGTKVPAGSGGSLVDASNVVWTFGVEDLPGIHQVVRGGVPTSRWGSFLKYHAHSVYDLDIDGHWYVWDGIGEWVDTGTTEP
jgi:hypothetical protein